MRTSIFECKGERLALVFLAPISHSKPSSVMYQPCPENKSCSFHDQSIKHQRPGIEGKLISYISRSWVDPLVAEA